MLNCMSSPLSSLAKWLLASLFCCNMAFAEEAQPAASCVLHNTFVRLTKDRQLKVVVVGNSVTAGAPAGSKYGKVPSFYVALDKWLHERFPDAQIQVVPKIIYAIGPEVQLFRMDERVIAEKPDLVLVEFGAANGAWGDKGRIVTEPATEGYIRRLRLLLPQTDCVMMMGIFKTMMEDYQQKKTPNSVLFLRSVAERYGCAVADAQKEVAQHVMEGEPLEAYMKDFIHPGDKGYELYSRVLLDEMERQWKMFQAEPEQNRTVHPHAFEETTLHPDPWLFPRLIPAYYAQATEGFEIAETGNLKYLASTGTGAQGSFTAPAQSRVVGILMRCPKGCGNLEIKSGDQWVRLAQRSEPHFTEGDDPANKLYRSFFATSGLPDSMEKVEFRVTPDPEEPGAQAVQIVGFLLVERPSALVFKRTGR